MTEQTLKEKTAKGLFWGGISNGVQQVLGVLIGIVLLKNLTPDDYGMVGLLAIFTGIANTIQESGFTAALTNRSEFKGEDYNAVFWFNLIVGSALYLVLFFSAPIIAAFYDQPELVALSRILFLSIIAGSLGIAHNAVLFRKLMVKERAKIDIFSTCVAGTIGVYMALTGFGYWALAVQTLVYATMTTLLRWYFSPWKPNFNFDFTPIKEMFGFSFKMLFSSIVAQIHANIYSVLLGKFYTIADVGYFSQGTKWAGMGTQMINGMVNGVAQPTFAQLCGDNNRLVQAFRKMLRFIAFISFPTMLGLAFVSNEFIILINESWLPCVPILQIYCFWGAIAPIYLLYTQVAVSYGRSDFYFWSHLLFAIFQITAAVLILPYGIYWIAVANVSISYIFLLIWHAFISTLIPIKIRDVLKDVVPYLLITCLIFVAIWGGVSVIGLKNELLLLIGKIVIAIILYLIIMWKSNSVVFRESILFIKKK